MNFEKSSLKLFLANTGSAIIMFLGIRHFAITAGAATIGSFFLFQAVLRMTSIPADFGLRSAVEKRISEGEAAGEYLSSAILLKLGLIVSVSVLIFLTRHLINDYIGSDVTWLIIGGLILREAAMVTQSIIRAELRVGETASLRLVRQVTWVTAGVILVREGYGARGLMIALLAGFCVDLLWGLYKTSVKPATPSIQRAKSLFNFGKFVIVSQVGGYFYSWMDVAIIGVFLTQADVGAYEVAWRVAAFSMLFSRALSRTLFPQISSWDADGAREKIEEFLPDLVLPSVALVIPSFFGVLVLSEEILTIVFQKEYAFVWLVLIILMFDKVTESIQLVFGRVLQAINRPDLAAKATFVAVLLNLVLNIILISQFGLVGAAVATTGASAIGGVLMHSWYLSKFIDLRIPVRGIVHCSFASAGMAIILYGVKSQVTIDSFLSLGVMIIGGGGLYAMLATLSPTLRNMFTSYVRKVVVS